MPHVLRRTCSSLLLVAAFSWLPSCGFGTAGVALGMGGGGGGTTAEARPTYELARDSSIGIALPTPGQLAVGELVDKTVSFASDGVYAASWRNGAGQVVASATLRGMTSRRLAVVVPLGLPSGGYKVEFAVGDGKAELVVAVGSATDVADPAAVVTAARAWWGTQRDALLATASVDTDAERKARSLADLSRLSGWLTTFDGAVASLDAVSLRTLADLLQASADLRAAEPSAPYVSVDLIAAQSAAASVLAEGGLTALAASSSVVAPQGSAAVLESLLPATQQISGLVAVLTAYDRWSKALTRPCKPIEGTLQVTAADGSPLTLRFTQPLPLRCRASCSSLTFADDSDPRVAGIAAQQVAVFVRQSALLPFTASLVQSRDPQAASVPIVQLTDLDPSRLVLVSQTSVAGLPTLVLQSGSLQASQYVLQSGSLQVGLRVAEASLGTATGMFRVVLDNPEAPVPDTVLIQPGAFQMGSPVTPLNVAPYFNQANSQPVHSVTITQPFWMGSYEVRQSEYQALMGSNPSFFQGANRPVEQVTWNQAVAYCDALTVQEAAAGRLPSGYEYRLPTEAEWEYCCRAGATTEFFYGPTLVCGMASFGFCSGSSSTEIVGSYPPNVWGLRDMHGNVREWCLDSWDGTPNYPAGSVSDPYVTSGPNRVVRGGSWSDGSDNCRSAYRYGLYPTDLSLGIGFRVVCAPVR